MENLTSLLEKHARNVSLRKEEKQDMRAFLVEYLAFAPVRTCALKEPYGFRVFFKHVFSLASFSRLNAYYLRGALLIALMVTGGTMSVTVAATSALPGDFLYPVKIRVNEEVRTVFMSSDEARVAWERERAEMRMREASTLVASGKLNEKAQEVLEKQLAIHTDTFMAHVRATASHDPVLATEMSDDFVDSMEAHEAVLARLIVEQNENIPPETRTFVEKVHTATQKTVEVNEIATHNDTPLLLTPDIPVVSTETNAVGGDVTTSQTPTTTRTLVTIPLEGIDTRAAYRAKKRADDHYREVQTLMETLEADAPLLASARLQIDSARVHIDEGLRALDAGEMVLAYNAYRTAGTRLKKVAQVLRATRLFSVQIADDILSDVAHETAEKKRGHTSRITTTEEVYLLHTETKQRINEARNLLLSYEGYGPAVSSRAHDHIKQSLTSMLRGEIALVLDDVRGAHTHVENADKHIKKSLELLTTSLQSPTVTKLHDTTTDDDLHATTTVSTSTPLRITHTFEDGIHYMGGEVPFASECGVVDADITSHPQDSQGLTLALHIHKASEASTHCATVATGTPSFIATSSASSEMMLVNVTLNGESVTWAIHGLATAEGDSSGTTSQPRINGSTEEVTLFRKAFEGARTLFSDQ